jgi:hypothetical protein
MMPDFIFDSALRVAPIVTAETIASSSARKRVEQILAFHQFSQSKIENPGAVLVHDYDG